MKRLIVLICLVSTTIFGQTPRVKSTTNLPSLSEGVDFGTEEIQVLEDDKRPASFSLTTSWIPGEGHKGFVRYRIRVTGVGVPLKEAPHYIDRLHACSFTLNLYDKGNFILRRIPLTFSRGIPRVATSLNYFLMI